tara:strand:+ start:1251 stop:1955 length:705 start_codon:yes stop_codon:yes gene_type:complete
METKLFEARNLIEGFFARKEMRIPLKRGSADFLEAKSLAEEVNQEYQGKLSSPLAITHPGIGKSHLISHNSILGGNYSHSTSYPKLLVPEGVEWNIQINDEESHQFVPEYFRDSEKRRFRPHIQFEDYLGIDIKKDTYNMGSRPPKWIVLRGPSEFNLNIDINPSEETIGELRERLNWPNKLPITLENLGKMATYLEIKNQLDYEERVRKRNEMFARHSISGGEMRLIKLEKEE